ERFISVRTVVVAGAGDVECGAVPPDTLCDCVAPRAGQRKGEVLPRGGRAAPQARVRRGAGIAKGNVSDLEHAKDAIGNRGGRAGGVQVDPRSGRAGPPAGVRTPAVRRAVERGAAGLLRTRGGVRARLRCPGGVEANPRVGGSIPY